MISSMPELYKRQLIKGFKTGSINKWLISVQVQGNDFVGFSVHGSSDYAISIFMENHPTQ